MPDRAEHDVQVNGLRFHCRVDGAAGAPWMVFSNSLLTNLALWDDQVAAFGDRFRILRYDQRGHGGTQVPDAPVTMDLLVQDAEALMAEFGITGATFVGVSMGAATALALAARAPERVARVVASDGQAATAPGGAMLWQERIEFARAHGMEAVADSTVRRWFRPGYGEAGGPEVARAREMIRTTALDGYLACANALQSYDVRQEMRAVRQPVLLLVGAADGALPQTMRAMQREIADARFVEIAEAGHLPNLEAPAAFNAAVREFLNEAPG